MLIVGVMGIVRFLAADVSVIRVGMAFCVKLDLVITNYVHQMIVKMDIVILTFKYVYVILVGVDNSVKYHQILDVIKILIVTIMDIVNFQAEIVFATGVIVDYDAKFVFCKSNSKFVNYTNYMMHKSNKFI